MHALLLKAGIRPEVDPAEVRGKAAVCRRQERFSMGDEGRQLTFCSVCTSSRLSSVGLPGQHTK